jgi:D-sedoheptulose 7-phosphate isomerase
MPVIEDYISSLQLSLKKLEVGKVEELARIMAGAVRRNKAVYAFGNGDSASNSLHFAMDFSKGASTAGRRLKAFSLAGNVPLMTAWGNDTKYDNIFKAQLEGVLEEGDVVVAISGSGNSPNILNAAEYAKKNKAYTVGLTGFDGGRLKGMCDLCIVAPSDNMERVEDVHFALIHMAKMRFLEELRKG